MSLSNSTPKEASYINNIFYSAHMLIKSKTGKINFKFWELICSVYHDKKSLKNRNVFVPSTKGKEYESVASSYLADCFCFLTSVEDRIVF